ncbi:hypothetical protein FQN60_013050 [Etheostoma spectabile]|uniref:Collectrin-like domain-containing protein n=1 Tax=Etheostoma spectabile TaxID=54343 RepID=A0A5J5DAN0_9PERO|nr:hypothetical protein FQN60_013050 [Etheostoma spectabile]
MLEKILVPLFAICFGQLCNPDASDGYKSTQHQHRAGNEAYVWMKHEMFLFPSTLAFAMRINLRQRAKNPGTASQRLSADR